MRKEDYKRALDDIKCSDEFKDKMEKMLSVPEGAVPEGYEDSVSSVEIAPKRYWLKSVAAAAAAVVLIGGAGTGAYHYLSSMDEELPPDIIATEPERETFSTPFGDVSKMMLTVNGENGFSLMDAPASMVGDIAQVLNDNEFVHLEVEKADGQYDKTEPFHITCYGDEQFELAVYPNGVEYCTVATRKEPQWYSCEDIYTKIQGAVAKNIIYADLSANEVMYDTGETLNFETLSIVDMQALSNDKKQKARESFEKYADSIELDYTSDGYPLLSSGDIMDIGEIEGMGYSPIVFGNYASMLIDNRYIVKINDDGSFEIFYLSLGGVGYTYVFNAPQELCTEIHGILTDKSNESTPWAGTDWDDTASLSFYHDGCQHTYHIRAENWYKAYFDKLDWTDTGLSEGDYDAQNEFDFFIGDGILKIDTNGNAYYDRVSGGKYYYSLGSSVYTDLLNYLKLSTGRTFEHEGALPERIREHWATVDTEFDLPAYNVVENDEKIDVLFRMSDEETQKLLDVIDSTTWEESPNTVTDEYMSHDVFTIYGFTFDRFGRVYDHDDGKLFDAVESDKINEMLGIIESSLKRDNIAYAQYLLLASKMNYTSMRCDVLPLDMTYEEASVIETDAVDLKQIILGNLRTTNIRSKTCKLTEEGVSKSFTLILELDQLTTMNIEFTIDDYGTPLYYKKTETNSETGEQKVVTGYKVENVEYFHDIEG